MSKVSLGDDHAGEDRIIVKLSMISCNDIYWTADDESTKSSKNGRIDRIRLSDDSSNEKRQPKKLQSKHKKNSLIKPKEKPSDVHPNPSLSSSSRTSVTLKDLNEEDKQKIAQLIKELAKVGEEKENVVNALRNERREFITQMQKMEEEKMNMMSKQSLLTEEVKQCQHLLQYYQNLIAMQQNSILAQEAKTEADPRPEKIKTMRNTSYDSTESSSSSRIVTADEIQVHEVDDDRCDTLDIEQSEDDIMQMSSRQYKDFLTRKKDKLRKEQESLRKLLVAHEASFHESNGHFSHEVVAQQSSAKKGISLVKNSKYTPKKMDMSIEGGSSLKKKLNFTPQKSFATNVPILHTPSNHKDSTGSNSNSFVKRQTMQFSQSSPQRETSEEKIFFSPCYSQDFYPDNIIANHDSVQQPLEADLSSQGSNRSYDCEECDDTQILEEIFFVV